MRARPRRSSSSVRRPFELTADAVAQLGRRLLGERDRHDLAHRDAGHGDERDDAVDQRLGLARARARLDEQRLVEALDDRQARRVVVVEDERSNASAGAAGSRRRSSASKSDGCSLTCRRSSITAASSSSTSSVGSSGVLLALPLALAVAGAARVGVGVAAPRTRPRAGWVERAREHAALDAVDDGAQHLVERALDSGVSACSAPLELATCVLTYQYAATDRGVGVAERAHAPRARTPGAAAVPPSRVGVDAVDAPVL